MDKIQKALRVLNEKERGQVRNILERIVAGNLQGLDIKKLKGRNDIFRVRWGDLRVIYRTHNGAFLVLAIERCSEKTYRL